MRSPEKSPVDVLRNPKLPPFQVLSVSAVIKISFGAAPSQVVGYATGSFFAAACARGRVADVALPSQVVIFLRGANPSNKGVPRKLGPWKILAGKVRVQKENGRRPLSGPPRGSCSEMRASRRGKRTGGIGSSQSRPAVVARPGVREAPALCGMAGLRQRRARCNLPPPLNSGPLICYLTKDFRS